MCPWCLVVWIIANDSCVGLPQEFPILERGQWLVHIFGTFFTVEVTTDVIVGEVFPSFGKFVLRCSFVLLGGVSI